MAAGVLAGLLGEGVDAVAILAIVNDAPAISGADIGIAMGRSLPRVESLLCWERIDFCLKPTLRVNHAIAYRSSAPGAPAWIVAVKQLYASHYFQVALDLAACVTDGEQASREGFYLITLKASRQAGLTGLRTRS